MSGFNVGLNVVEVDGLVAPSIPAAPTSVAGLIIRSERGVAGAVHRITNMTEFQDRFGSFIDGAFGAYAIKGFFDNGGGVAYVTRVVAGTAVGATRTFPGGGADSLTVAAGYRGDFDPGAWGNAIEVRFSDNSDDPNTYDLTVRYRNKVEVFEGLNQDDTEGAPGRNPAAVINDVFSGSKLIRATVNGTDNPDPTAGDGFEALGGGEDDALAGAAMQNAINAALPRFDIYNIQLLCCPESDSNAWVTTALAYCAGRGDCMFIGHTPFANDAEAARGYGGALRGEKVYGALYFPWIQVPDPIGAQRWIPPTGAIMGVFARTERERGIWKAPAGNAARLRGVLDIRFAITDAVHTDLVKNGSVNAVRFVPGQGVIIDSSRTLSTSSLWYYVNVRLLFNFVKSSLMGGLRWVVQEPNDQTLWNKVKFNSVTPFLMGLWRRGAFGSGAPEDLFTVKIDAENNPPDQVQLGNLNIEVYFYPSRPAETIVITVGQQEAGASATES